MRLFVQMLRERIWSPVSLASIARDLQISPTTLGRYLQILETLHIVFLVRPFHHNIARALLKEPKVYFYDTGLVIGDDGTRFENACATMLYAQIKLLREALGTEKSLHYIRNKEGREIDFVICDSGVPLQFIESKWADLKYQSTCAWTGIRFPAQKPPIGSSSAPKRAARFDICGTAADWLAK